MTGAAIAEWMNRESYDAIAEQWDETRHSFNGREREYLKTLIAGLPAGARVLDLGCGTGRPMVEYLLSKGLPVTGVDQSRGLLSFARTRFPGATWIEARIEDFVPHQLYEAVVCWDSLFHIDRREHAELFRRFASMLVPRGRLMFTCGGSAHPAFTDTMFGRTFFYDSHPPEVELELAREAGFEPIVAEFLNPPTTGRDKGRFAVVSRRIE